MRAERSKDEIGEEARGGTQAVALRTHEEVVDSQEPTAIEGLEQKGRESAEADRTHGIVKRIPWPLAGVLAIQAILSLRLIWYNTAFEDEALYLWAGHMEWAHWLHGASVQSFQTWFSGAPVLYPPLAALADSVGGLAAARLLSLLLMLGVTCFLWGTARRLVGDRAALVAVAAFATLAGTAFLGAFATYDALALFLLTCAAWLVVRASHRSVHKARFGMWLLSGACFTAGVLLGLACAVKYAVALFVPLCLIVGALSAWREPRQFDLGDVQREQKSDASREKWHRAAVIGLAAAAGVVVTLTIGLAFGGHAYWQGILATTLNRPAATSSPFSVLKLSYLWTGFILVLSLAAIIIGRREDTAYRWLLRVFALSVLLVPVEQARVDTTVSLHKHVVFGAWFAAMAAGYTFSRISQVDKTRGGWAFVAAIPIIACTLLDGIPQASALFSGWQNVTPISVNLPQLIARYPGRYLTSTYLYQVLGYYNHGNVPWPQWQGDLTFSANGLHAGLKSDEAAIKGEYFSLIIIANPGERLDETDASVIADLKRAGDYHIVANTDGFEAWAPMERS